MEEMSLVTRALLAKGMKAALRGLATDTTVALRRDAALQRPVGACTQAHRSRGLAVTWITGAAAWWRTPGTMRTLPG